MKFASRSVSWLLGSTPRRSRNCRAITRSVARPRRPTPQASPSARPLVDICIVRAPLLKVSSNVSFHHFGLSSEGGTVGRFFKPCADPKTQSAVPGDPLEPHYSVQEIATLWKLDPETVSKIFRDEPGVLVLGNSCRKDGKRNYTILRIPDSVLRRVYNRRTQRQPDSFTRINRTIRTRAGKPAGSPSKPGPSNGG